MFLKRISIGLTRSKYINTIANGELTWSYCAAPSPVPLQGGNVAQYVERARQQYEDHTAIIVRHQNVRKTFREIDEEVFQIIPDSISQK